MEMERILTAVGCMLIAASGSTCVQAADKQDSGKTEMVTSEDVAGTAHEEDLVSLSFGKLRLRNAILLFAHMSAFNIAYDPDIIPDARVSVNATDTPWKTLIENALSEHGLTLTKKGPDNYVITRAVTPKNEASRRIDWKGAARENIRLRQIVSRNGENLAILDNFGLVESGCVISAPFGSHLYAWHVNVNSDSISFNFPAPSRG